MDEGTKIMLVFDKSNFKNSTNLPRRQKGIKILYVQPHIFKIRQTANICFIATNTSLILTIIILI